MSGSRSEVLSTRDITSVTAATILIVDDELRNRKLLELLLKHEGYLTLSAANGEQALALIAQCAPDLILLDVMMPGMDGYEVAGTLKADPATSNIPIIMVTAKTEHGARLAALDAGAEEFLTKPVERAELWLRVRNLLRLKAYGDFLQNHNLVLEEQVQARTESLRASESRFRQMADAIHDVFFLIDADTNRVVYVSPAYEEIWGRSRESLYANPDSWTEAIHPDDQASTYEKHKKGMSEAKFEYAYRIVRPDGSIRLMEVRGFPVHDDTGRTVRIAGIVVDITEREQAAQESRESERRFSDMMGNVEMVSIMLDLEARITYCNEYLLHLTGWRHEEVIGGSWFELFMPPEHDDLKKIFATLLANQPEAWHHENEILTRSGERRLIRWSNSVLRSGAGDVIGTASLGEDITERRIADDVLRKRAAELELFHRLSVGRELQMVELKKEINELARQAGRKPPYALAFLGPETEDT